MFDVITYALLKKKIEQAASGIQDIKYQDGKLIFSLADGNTIEVPLDISSGVAGALVDESGALVISFSDGTKLIYDVPSLVENSLAPVKEQVTANTTLLEDLGLSVVNGMLHLPYEGGETNE